nr:Mucin-4 beta chain like [Ipomoea batatas]
MEDKGKLIAGKLNCSFMAMALFGETISSLSSSPLFSAIITLYTLILLYFPSLVFSPVLISTSVLLFSLLRLGADQRTGRLEPEKCFVSVDRVSPPPLESLLDDPGQCRDPFYSEPFVEWDVRAPLEVIYEEGGEEDDDVLEGKRAAEIGGGGGIQRYDSLSLYYPETDSDTSSEGDFPVIGEWESLETMCFRWEEEEEDREELIEIELDGKRNLVCEIEEDNLIEIDLSPA